MASTLAPARAPLRLPIHTTHIIDCPRAGDRPATDCDDCRYLQGTLGGGDPAVLCGYLEPRLAIIRRLPFPQSLESRGPVHEQTRTSAAQRAAHAAATQASTVAATSAGAAGSPEAPAEALIFETDWPEE
jgi:hypothetical protein